MTIYLAGRMKHIPEMNKARFDTYEKKLIDLGMRVFNPHRVNDSKPGLKEVEYMGIDLQQISVSDAVYVIPGWEGSKGAKFEVFFALNYGIPVYFAEKLTKIEWFDINLNIQITTK
jgi:nucleoside 2-deoxyribosyltransferase